MMESEVLEVEPVEPCWALDPSFSTDEVKEIVNHVFLPRNLPQSQRSNLIGDESNILKLITSVIENLEHNFSALIPKSTVRLFQMWSSLQCGQNLSEKKISTAIKSLEIGEMFALYIRKQNCGLILSMPKETTEDEAIFSTFPASLQNETLLTGEIGMQFPVESVKIPFSYILIDDPFGQQLSILHEKDFESLLPEFQNKKHKLPACRDVPDPVFVTEWLAATLAGQNSDLCSASEFPKVFKKVRDILVLGRSSGTVFPFRRSGLWMVIKVALQINLEREFGREDGKFLYKLILIEFLTQICELKEDAASDNDLSIQMLAKVARRLEKLEKLSSSLSNTALKEMHKIIHEKALNVIHDIRLKMNEHFDVICQVDIERSRLEPLKNLDFEIDVIQTIPKVVHYIEWRNDSSKSLAAAEKYKFIPTIQFRRHDVLTKEIPPVQNTLSVHEFGMGFSLTDAEDFILECLDNGFDPISIRNFAFCEYLHNARAYYKDDPLGGSRMILIFLWIIKVLDAIAVEEHPTLRDHHSGIHTNVINQLLLPKRKYLEKGFELQRYFDERNNCSKFPSLIGENEVSKNSFSARFPETNEKMCDLRGQILAKAKKEIEEKLVEVNALREKVAAWKEELARLSCCEYRLIFHHFYCISTSQENFLPCLDDRCTVSRKEHIPACRKCDLEKKIEGAKVWMYEKPLSDQIHNQNAVVFELLIPVKVACLRDVLFTFSMEFCKKADTYITKKVFHHETWKNCSRLPHPKTKVANYDHRIHLGSTRKSARLEYIHVTASDDSIILRNNRNCSYYGEGSFLSGTSGIFEITRQIEQDNVKEFCTLTVEKGSLYKDLQWALSGTDHSPNNIIATKSKCPQSLPLSDWVEFGTLRSGHRIQIRNLVRVMDAGKLSCKSESVVSLIAQALWEAGPNEYENWFRESHEDLVDIPFSLKMGKILDNFLQTHRNNWKQPYCLMTIIVITNRVLEMNSNEDVSDAFVNILLKCREVAVEWMSTIETVMKRTSDENFRKKLRDSIIITAMSCALTFSLDPTVESFKQILGSPRQATIWLLSLVTLDNNMILGGTASANESVTRRNFLRIIRNTGLNITEELKRILSSDGYSELNNFAGNQWAAGPVKNTKWNLHGTTFYKSAKDNNRIYRCIQVDLIHGKFLVDGNPVARLPEKIAIHPLFQRTFHKTMFEVQSYGQDSFCTLSRYGGCKYVFQMINRIQLIITEQRPNGDFYELIPHSIFKDDVNYPLFQDYSHFWNKDKGKIEFRAYDGISMKDNEASTNYEYELNLNSRKLIQISSGKMIVDVRSNTFKEISQFLSRFEKEEYIKILTDANHKAVVELSRMRLHFNVMENFRLESQEYEGMQISLRHKIDGCFIGLQNGLVLEETCENGEQKLFLLPHGEITIENGNIEVFLGKLRKPFFFVYDINHHFRQIKAGKSYSAWFYLAYFHGISAHPLEDPFTGMTGTERALEILQSALCWSCEPYDAESLKTMQDIAKLTPSRQYFNSGAIKKMENVVWPSFLNSTAASHELYVTIVNKLISDSQRLCFLFNGIPSPQIKSDTVQELNEKAYRRHSCYNPNADISEDFLFIKKINFQEIGENGYYPLRNSSFENISYLQKNSYKSHRDPDVIRTNMRIISRLKDHGYYHLSRTPLVILDEFLLREPTLTGVDLRYFRYNIQKLENWLQVDLKENFLKLYRVARTIHNNNQHSEWILFLSCLAFCGHNLDILLILHIVSRNPTIFKNKVKNPPENQNLDPPSISSYTDPSHNTFNAPAVRKILESCQIGVDNYLSSKNCKNNSNYHNETYHRQYCARRDSLMRQFYVQELNTELNLFTAQIQNIWPIDDCHSLKLETELINILEAKRQINVFLKRWNDNRKLFLFVNAISKKCRLLTGLSRLNVLPAPVMWQRPEEILPEKIKFEINFEEKMNSCFVANVKLPMFLAAGEIFKKGDFGCPFEFEQNVNAKNVDAEILKKRLNFFSTKGKRFWNILISSSAPPEVSHLIDSGLYPRLIPLQMLSKLLPYKESKNELAINSLIGACGVLWTLEQQANRMIKYQRKLNQFENLLQRELETTAHDGWSPMQRPEWLLFELESNLMIRAIQIKVAERMMKPPGDKHSVMQLNMGEGKTAVIVPLLCLSLADGNSLCRVTVLRSLFRTNFSALRHNIGGLLNRRIYSFPCRRDMTIGQRQIKEMQILYEECLDKRGVVLTLPEYLLSFQLKMYETALKKDVQTASLFLNTQKWLNKNARDILDESDEILHAKYQLIYTVGAKSPVAGEDLRWSVAQNLLKRIPEKMKLLCEKFGVESIEFDEVFDEKNGPEIFTPCRLLRVEVYRDLVDELAEDILAGRVTMTKCQFPDLCADEKRVVKEFLTKRTVDEKTHNEALAIFSDNPVQMDMLLILAGYLKYEVLCVALSKRWRVNYGVNPKGHLQMAVPFKAKDVATEMTEFGHPDVAICLTLLSYYYFGLSDSQLLECFQRLERMPNADTTYEGWINEITKTAVDPSVKIYNGLPLEDRKRRDEFLFPVLRKNMYVIDFWLAHNVFPNEARQFEKKMMTTAWDLVSEDKNKIVTGFSGTNDSKELLPGPICQNDLEELEETNENVRKTLLREENDDFYALPANVTGMAILEELVKKRIPVLLDSGALMLELNNEQVVEKWLELIPDTNIIKEEVSKNIEAAVYFNENNILMVKDRQNRVTEFELSSYRDRLNRCIVYLDDSHTRGTDLKFPGNTRACVTLGGGITRDKTVQACMRMRMLGKGHSISFWGSQEAYNGIRELCGHQNEIKTEDVLKWIESNSRNFEKNGLVHWTSSGMNYAKKRASHKLLSCVDIAKLSQHCSDAEILELMEMYGRVRNEELFTKIISHHFDVMDQSFDAERKFKYENLPAAKRIILKTRNLILERLWEHIPEVKRFAELIDEEQEKEMEQEKERDVEVHRHVEPATPAKSQLDKNIELCIKIGFDSMIFCSGFWHKSVVELPVELRKYKLGNQLDSTWGEMVFATKDFISVVQSYSGYNEEFLRLPSWIVSFPTSHLLLISPYEANAYLSIFRYENPVSTLHMYSPRLRPKQNSLLNIRELQIPIRDTIFVVDGQLTAQLSIFSGSMYFRDEKEQEEFSYFVGVVPRPRSEKQQQHFENGLITKSGFVLPANRSLVSESIEEKCKFQNNPDKFLCSIIKARHGFFLSSSHVSMLVLKARKNTYE